MARGITHIIQDLHTTTFAPHDCAMRLCSQIHFGVTCYAMPWSPMQSITRATKEILKRLMSSLRSDLRDGGGPGGGDLASANGSTVMHARSV
jgi:hypothetical protein